MIGLINDAMAPVANGVRLNFALARRLYEFPLKSPPGSHRQQPAGTHSLYGDTAGRWKNYQQHLI